MADNDASPPRIRWQPEPGLFAGFSGYVGAVEQALFRIYDPDAPDGEHALCSMLPGMGNQASYGTEAEVKARAEEWLAEFASSLGAVFPPPPEWGVRFTIGHPHESAAKDEADARDVLANMRELHPEWEAVLLTRSPEIPAGPWKVADDD